MTYFIIVHFSYVYIIIKTCFSFRFNHLNVIQNRHFSIDVLRLLSPLFVRRCNKASFKMSFIIYFINNFLQCDLPITIVSQIPTVLLK